MKGLVVLVTGSTDGIGRQTAIDLAKRGAHVVIHGRNQHRAEAAFEEVVAGSGSSDLAMVSGDLASPDGTRSISDAVHARYDRIDVLINNAGVYKTDRQLSHDGFELTFAVNHLSYFLLTGLLLDLVRRSSHARIINVALRHMPAGSILKTCRGSGGAGVQEGSLTSVYLAASPDVDGVTGRYFSSSREVRPAAIAGDRAVQDELWRRSAEMTGFDYPH